MTASSSPAGNGNGKPVAGDLVKAWPIPAAAGGLGVAFLGAHLMVLNQVSELQADFGSRITKLETVLQSTHTTLQRIEAGVETRISRDDVRGMMETMNVRFSGRLDRLEEKVDENTKTLRELRK